MNNRQQRRRPGEGMGRGRGTRFPVMDYEQAMRGVGKDPTDQGRWLLTFAASERERMTGQRWLRLKSEVSAWVFGPVFYGIPLSDADTKEWQNKLRKGWKYMVDGPGFILSLNPQNAFSLVQGRLKWERRGTGDLFNQAVNDLLVSLGERFRSCLNGKCRTLFIARKRQAYCSSSCSQAVRTRTFRDNNREAFRQKRKEDYWRKQQSAYGAKLRKQPYERKKR